MFFILCWMNLVPLFIKSISLYNTIEFLAILYPESLANLMVEVGTRYSHQILFQIHHSGMKWHTVFLSATKAPIVIIAYTIWYICIRFAPSCVVLLGVMGRFQSSGPLFTKQTDVLLVDLAKSRSREIRVYTLSIALKFDRHLGSLSNFRAIPSWYTIV